MDHVYNGYRHLLGGEKMARLPSEYFFENVYLTFQSDRIAFQTAHLANPKRFMWASDFPHGDSTWPNSIQQIETMTSNLSDELRNMIIRENVTELYGLKN
jgi:predicted TIM-barrel fold metal-dependent hydrolase